MSLSARCLGYYKFPKGYVQVGHFVVVYVIVERRTPMINMA